MRRALLLLAALGLALGLAACGKSGPAHDLAYYRANAPARQAKIAECSGTPANASAPDCLAAVQASGEAESQRALQYQRPVSRLKNAGHL